MRAEVDLNATVERLVRVRLGYGTEHPADCLAQSPKTELPEHANFDRLMHRSHVLNTKGRSYRLRNLEQAISLRL